MHWVLMSVLVLVGWVTPSTAGLKSNTDTDLIIMVVQGWSKWCASYDGFAVPIGWMCGTKDAVWIITMITRAVTAQRARIIRYIPDGD
ncbi:hypothetical protein CY34DRAFT_808511 [Suillus luteus UH-Slu-Lm8-n1]|uniref:Uncharacterized protein n=1 Tax=Suillus luteus UH-Slu-Lm8-n1 TaxID=930992 RepID=A0A0D0AY06_9AGAM|nr:hypothetical protein CY34DRAFT_808511 [Suillus luteus UH-Slu-Lm8-n1]